MIQILWLIFFYHCNPQIPKLVLNKNLGSHGLYTFTGFYHPSMNSLLPRILKSKVLRIICPLVLEGFFSIGQVSYLSLKKTLDNEEGRLERFNQFVLIFSLKMGHLEEISTIFTEFCGE